MRWSYGSVGLGLTLFVAAVFIAGGCEKVERRSKADSKPDKVAEKHDHEEWWCAVHGIPEEECSMCSEKVAAECKKNGDWCKEHECAKSQCFKCDPSLKEKYAAKYRAKYGEEPPAMAEKN